MTKDEFYKAGFSVETLPSGRINITNTTPFFVGARRTICCWSGRYLMTTEYKNLDEILKQDIQLIWR